MTDIRTVEYGLPSHWASALINDDQSGMEDSEIQDMNDILDRIQALEGGHVYCVGVEDEQEFARPDFDLPYGNVATFIFHVFPKEE